MIHVWTYLETIPGARDNIFGRAPYSSYLLKRTLDEVYDKYKNELIKIGKQQFPENLKEYRQVRHQLHKVATGLQQEYYEFDRWFGQKTRTEVPEELVKKKLDKLFVYAEKQAELIKDKFQKSAKKEERTLDLFIEHFEGTEERGVWIKRSRLYEYYHEWMKGSEKNLTTNLKLKAKLCERIGQTQEVVKKGKKVIVPKDCKVRGHYVFKCTTKFKDLD